MKNSIYILFIIFSSCRYFERGDKYKIIREDLAQTRAELEERIGGNTLLAEEELNAISLHLANIQKANNERIQLMDLMDKLIGAADKSSNRQMTFDYKKLSNEIMNYRALMMTLVQDSLTLHAKTLNVNADTLGKYHFTEKSGEEISLYLNKFTVDVLLLNDEVISQLISDSKKVFYPIDSLEMRVLSKSNTVKKGENFTAEILFSTCETSNNAVFFVSDSINSAKNELAGNIDTVYANEENGNRFFYSFKPKKAGEYTLYFMGMKKSSQNGFVKKFPVKVRFKVK